MSRTPQRSVDHIGELLGSSLKDSEVFTTIIDAIADPIFVKDQEHRWILMNRAFCDFLGLSREELYGKSDYEFFPREQADVFWEKDNQVFTSMQQLTNEENLTDNQGNLHVISTKKVPFELPDGKKVLVGIIRDITDIVHARRDLELARDQAHAASEAKSAFLARVSHDIRTPMNGILGVSELLMDSDLNPCQLEMAQTIRESTLSLLGLVNDILDISQIEAKSLKLHERNFDLEREIRNLVAVFKPKMAAASINFELNLPQNLPKKLFGDVDKLSQILINLVSNAIKFTPQSGRIELGIRSRELMADRVELEFSISDTGSGIATAEIPRIFQPFYQTQGTYSGEAPGSGLGLAIVSHLVKMLGGEISVRSQPGVGSVFTFNAYMQVLSERDDLELGAREGIFDLPRLTRAGISPRILVAEDNPINQNLIRSLLQRMNCEVDLASNGQQAVDLALENFYDLLLMDISMPLLDGVTAARHIRAKKSEEMLPIIALTAHAILGDRERFETAGINGYISKPIEREKLFKEFIRLVPFEYEFPEKKA